MQQTALGVLMVSGLAAGAAFWTGEGAEEAIETRIGTGQAYLERHEEAGLVGLVMAGVAGGVALLVLASGWKGRPLSRGLAALNVLIALAAGGTLAWVANLGGQIGHPEIRNGQLAPPGERDERADSPSANATIKSER